MTKKFNELFQKLPAEAQRRAEQKAKQMHEALALDELREARELTQVELSKKLGTSQAAVSKLENRTDMYLSTLAGVIDAMGGRLEMRAVFPSGEIHPLTVGRKEGQQASHMTGSVKEVAHDAAGPVGAANHQPSRHRQKARRARPAVAD